MARGRKPLIDHDTCLELYNQGLSDPQIAEIFGVRQQSVQQWRLKNKLKAHQQQNHPEPDTDKLRPRKPLYFPLEELDLTFYFSEVERVIKYYKQGMSVDDIAIKLRRQPESVAVLVMDLALKDRL